MQLTEDDTYPLYPTIRLGHGDTILTLGTNGNEEWCVMVQDALYPQSPGDVPVNDCGGPIRAVLVFGAREHAENAFRALVNAQEV